MRFLIFTFTFLNFLIYNKINAAYRNFTDNWFNQTLDHFDPTNNQTFQERFWFNDEYFDQSERTVVFLFLTGEDQLWPEWMTNGTWISYANYFGGLAVALEHRYYGNSAPTSNFTVENLRYLTTQQALADIAKFVANVEIPNNTFVHEPQWIIYSGSYPGQLAAWARLIYPHLIKGVVVSSAPFETKLVIPEYLDTVADDIQSTSEECYNIIGEGFAQIEELMNTTEGRATLTSELSLCTPINDTSDKYELQTVIVQLQIDYQGIAQSSWVNKMSYASAEVRQNRSLDHICSILTDNSTQKSSLARLNDVAQFIREGECLDHGYATYINDLQDTSNSGRLTWWQRCTEWGNIQIQNSNGSSKIFGSIVEVEYYVDQCRGIFGNWLDISRQQAGLNNIVQSFGALKINITSAVFVYGSYDPWHNLGLLKSNNLDSPVILINGSSHCADMFPAADNDPQELTNARATIQELIESWLS